MEKTPAKERRRQQTERARIAAVAARQRRREALAATLLRDAGWVCIPDAGIAAQEMTADEIITIIVVQRRDQ